MDLATTPLFGLMRERMAWLAQRQRVLAENIANADTPRFRPRDIAPFVPRGDQSEVRAEADLALTQPGHIAPAGDAARGVGEEKARTVYEATPSGNAVVLEEQMAKVNETAIAHRLAAQVYRKYLGLVRLAASSKS
jgi:flagellar basal-body rod protein FlgB